MFLPNLFNKGSMEKQSEKGKDRSFIRARTVVRETKEFTRLLPDVWCREHKKRGTQNFRQETEGVPR